MVPDVLAENDSPYEDDRADTLNVAGGRTADGARRVHDADAVALDAIDPVSCASAPPTRANPVGTASVSVTPCAARSPALLTVAVSVNVVEGSTVPGAAALTTSDGPERGTNPPLWARPNVSVAPENVPVERTASTAGSNSVETNCSTLSRVDADEVRRELSCSA